MNWRVPLFDPDLGESEVNAVTRVISSKWLTMGDLTAEFESRFATFLGCRYAIALSSGTAALHLSLVAAGVGPGDEVICPSLTFVATANAIRYCGAKPVFADVHSLDDWNVSRASLEAVATSRTKAVIVVHYAGYPCDMPAIMEFARSHGLIVIEDAAHAAGAVLGGRALGTWGDLGCFSFFSNKNMTTAEGGMLITDVIELAERVRLLRSHGMTTLTLDRHRGHAFAYDVVDLGYNYRMNELNAALGLAQLAALGHRNAQRAQWVVEYRRCLSSVPGLRVPFSTPMGRPAHHLMPALLPDGCDRLHVMEAMKARGVQTSIHYRPIDTFTSYREAGFGPCSHLPNTYTIGARGLTLPLYPSMTAQDVTYVCEALEHVLERAPSTGTVGAPPT